jgi:hypothetical protein
MKRKLQNKFLVFADEKQRESGEEKRTSFQRAHTRVQKDTQQKLRNSSCTPTNLPGRRERELRNGKFPLLGVEVRRASKLRGTSKFEKAAAQEKPFRRRE